VVISHKQQLASFTFGPTACDPPTKNLRFSVLAISNAKSRASAGNAGVFRWHKIGGGLVAHTQQQLNRAESYFQWRDLQLTDSPQVTRKLHVEFRISNNMKYSNNLAAPVTSLLMSAHPASKGDFPSEFTHRCCSPVFVIVPLYCRFESSRRPAQQDIFSSYYDSGGSDRSDPGSASSGPQLRVTLLARDSEL
jgi:hypothetical protein